MLSFKEFSPDDIAILSEELCAAIPGAEREDIESVIDTCAQMTENEDISLGICAAYGCALVRIFELGRYCFAYPIALTDDADDFEALEALAAYSVKEEIPFELVDVPREALLSVVGEFRHTSVDMTDAEGECFRVKVQSEASLLSEVPAVFSGAVELAELCDADTEKYAELCRHPEVNKYWGYDYRLDEPDAEDGYFIRSARLELARGVSVTFAVREKGELVGEAVIYGFDLRGGAQIGFRLLPEWQGKGLGRATLEGLILAGRRLSLLRFYATVREENIPSRCLLSRYADEQLMSDGTVKYEIELI